MNTRTGLWPSLKQGVAKSLRRSLWLPAWLRNTGDERVVRPSPSQHATSYDNGYPLLRFSQNDYFTLGNAFEGVHIFGGNGSGKTTGPGAALLKAQMRAGFGGLVLTAKPDECALIKRYAQETGCLDRVIVFSPEEKWRFNFLTYEQRRPARGAGLTANIVKLFSTIQDSFERGDDAGGKQERYWKNALNQLLHNTVDLILLGGDDLSVSLLHEVITSAPASAEQVDSEAWQAHSSTYQLLERALRNEGLSPRQRSDLKITGKFWLTEFPQLPSDTRGSIVSTFTTTADVFLRGTIGELFSTGLNIVPEVTLEGAILVIDLPVKTYGYVGLASQILWKYVWQQAIERRDVTKNPRPVFLWADEAHNFVNASDVQFQTTARSSRCCTTFLSQTLPNYYWALGGEQKGQALTESLMGVLQTKVFCANSDPKTTEWSSSIFAKSFQSKFQSGINRNEKGGGGSNAGASESLEYNVQPAEFLSLRKGGPANQFLVDTIIFQGGRVFNATGQTSIRVAFRQS